MSAMIEKKPETEDWEGEWDDVEHFLTVPFDEPAQPIGKSVMANCGAATVIRNEAIGADEHFDNECPLCQAIHEEIISKQP